MDDGYAAAREKFLKLRRPVLKFAGGGEVGWLPPRLLREWV
jgi:hypothetical protein